MMAIPPTTPTATMSLWSVFDEERAIATPPPASGSTFRCSVSNTSLITPIVVNCTNRNPAKDTSTPSMVHPDGDEPPPARSIIARRPSQSKQASGQASSSSSRLCRFRRRDQAYKFLTADTSQVTDGRMPPQDMRSADDGRLGTRSDGKDRLLPAIEAANGGHGLSSSLNGRRLRRSSWSWSPLGVAEQPPQRVSSLGFMPSLPFTVADEVPPPPPPGVSTRPCRSRPRGAGQSSSPLDRMVESDRSLGLYDESSSQVSSLDGGSSSSSSCSERPPPATSSSITIRRKSRPRHRSIPAEDVRGVLSRSPRYTERRVVHPGSPGDSSNNGRRRRRSSMPYSSAEPPSPAPSDLTNSLTLLGPDDIQKRLMGSSCSSLDYLGDGGSSGDDDEDDRDRDDADKGRRGTLSRIPSHNSASSWVPLGVDFSPSMEVYVFQKD